MAGFEKGNPDGGLIKEKMKRKRVEVPSSCGRSFS